MYRFACVPHLYNQQQHYILTTPVYAISRSILTLMIFISMIMLATSFTFWLMQTKNKRTWTDCYEETLILMSVSTVRSVALSGRVLLLKARLIYYFPGCVNIFKFVCQPMIWLNAVYMTTKWAAYIFKTNSLNYCQVFVKLYSIYVSRKSKVLCGSFCHFLTFFIVV